MKVFFYIWCVMAILGVVATFFNSGHFWFSFVPSFLMAIAAYPEAKEEVENEK